MSTASQLNFAAAQRERDRRQAMRNSGEGDPVGLAQADYLGPGWDAFFGALHDKEDAANASGLNFKVNFSGLGQDMPDKPFYTTSAPGLASNLLATQLQEQNRMQQLQDQNLAEGKLSEVAGDMGKSYNDHLLAAANLGVDTSTPEGQKTFLSRLPPNLRAPYEQHFAELAKAGEQNKLTEEQIASSQAKTKLAEEQFKATYGVGLNDQGQPVASPLAKQIAEYRVPPPSTRSLATPAGQALMAQVQNLNPDFRADMFPAAQSMRKAFTSGPQAQTLNSLNTAIEHLDQFKAAADALGNGNFKPGNAAYNWVRDQFGSSAPSNFNGIKTIMSGELASAFKKSGATDQEIAAVQHALDSASSPSQLSDYVTKIAIPALGSKAATYQQQWQATMGARDPFSVYTPGAKAVLEKYGAPGSAGSAPQTAGGGFVVMDPSGGRHTFPTQAAADQFKKAAGIQ